MLVGVGWPRQAGFVIVSVHLADVGRPVALRLLRTKLDPAKVPGLRYAVMTTTAPLSGHLLPRPNLGGVGLIAAWDDDRAVEDFLAGHPLAERLAHGWRVRLRPTRIYGAWSPLPDLPDRLAGEESADAAEPAAVLTIGRLRLTQTIRFLKASARAEELAVRDPALLASTGLARPPGLVATFSLWRSIPAMRAYVQGSTDPGHLAALEAHAAQPFHHESAFVRFRPYGAVGEWDGRNPLAATASETLGARGG
ncbi:MAG: spheroidene monooxygenase [Solirubrobacterales bacterium]